MQELLEKYHETKDIHIRNQIIILCDSLIKKYCNRITYGFDKDDLYQECIFGLIEALSRYDTNKGMTFSSYSRWQLRNAITEYISNYWTIVVIPIKRFTKMVNDNDDYQLINSNNTQTEPNNSNVLYFPKYISTSTKVSIDEDNEIIIEDLLISDENDIFEKYSKDLERRKLMWLIENTKLTKREKETVLLYINSNSNNEVIEKLKFSKQRLDQIIDNVIIKFKKKIKESFKYYDAKCI
jgi:RNA polymerase sigma factor for flagellar operon FliA